MRGVLAAIREAAVLRGLVGHLRSLRRGSAKARLRSFTGGRKVTVPLAIEFRHDGATLPKTMPHVMAARVRAVCSRDGGVLRVKGGRMVPGFDAAFWNALAAQTAGGELRCLRRDEFLLLAVPMAHPPGGGVHVRLRKDDLTVLAGSLSRSHPGRPGPPPART